MNCKNNQANQVRVKANPKVVAIILQIMKWMKWLKGRKIINWKRLKKFKKN